MKLVCIFSSKLSLLICNLHYTDCVEFIIRIITLWALFKFFVSYRCQFVKCDANLLVVLEI